MMDITPHVEQIWSDRPVEPNKDALTLEEEFGARYPNAYGVYGAGKEVLKASLPYVKYIDPEERERFMELTQQEQTRDLLFEALNTAVLGRWKPISKFGVEVGKASGEVLSSWLPKTAEAFTRPIPTTRILAGQRGSVKGEIVEPGASSQAKEEATSPVWDKVKKLQDDFDNIVDAQRRGTRSHELAAEEAKKIGMTIEDVKNIAPGTAMNDAQAVAVVNTVEEVAGAVQESALTALKNNTKESWDDFLNNFLALGEVDPARRGILAESGRSLSVLNDPVKGTNKYLDQFQEVLSRSDLTKEQLAVYLSTFKTKGEIAEAARLALKPGKVGAIVQLWVKGLLTGIPTHAANIAGNSLYLGIQAPERLIAAGIGKLTPGKAEVSVNEAGALLRGGLLGFRDGLRLAGKTYLSGDSEFAKMRGLIPSAKMEIDSKMTEAFGDNIFGRALQLYDDVLGYGSTRPLLAADDFFKAVAYRGELHALAIREVERLGLTGKDAAKKISLILEKTPPSFGKEAGKFADYVTFQEELGAAGEGMLNLVNKVPPLRFILPFVKTPANIFTGAIDRTPMAFFRQAVRDDIKAGGAKRDLALARVALGSTLAATASALFLDGKITGSGPSGPGQRAAMSRLGWIPNAVKVGKEYVAYGRVTEPLGTIIGIAATATEIIQEAAQGDIDVNVNEIANVVVSAFSKVVMDKTFMQGFTKIVMAIEEPERRFKSYVNDLAASFVPAAVTSAARAIDPELKDVQTMLDAIKARIPVLSKTVPRKLDRWGEPVEREALGPDVLSPVRVSEEKDSPIDREIRANRMNVTMPRREIEGVKLLPEEYERFVILQGNGMRGNFTGKGLKDTLNELVASPEYLARSTGPEGGRALMIEQRVNAFREQAKYQMLNEFPELRTEVERRRLQRQLAR